MSDGSVLRAGAAEVDITPDYDIQIAGDIGRRRPVEEIRERIYAKALVLERGERRFCLLSLEICAIVDKWIEEIRRRAAERFGLDPHALMIHPLQNHAAPTIGNHMCRDEYAGLPDELWWLRGGDERYNEPALAGIMEAIGQALERVEPVTAHVGREIDGRVAFNRRFVMRDGSARGHPKPHERKQILHREGPIDPEVGVMLLKSSDGRNVAALLHYTCHPVHGYPHTYIIADWPGTWASSMRGALGKDCVALVINGCCGNIHHNDHLNPHAINDHVRMGSLLADSAGRAMRDLATQPSEALDWRDTTVRLPFRELPEQEIARARQLLSRHPEPIMEERGGLPSVSWDWVYAHSMLDLEERYQQQAFYDYEVQVLRVAGSALVALVGEPFVEVQLSIKAQSPFAHTFVAHMCNGYVGYVPTPEALEKGGYETNTANWSKLRPDALETIGSTAIELLHELAS